MSARGKGFQPRGSREAASPGMDCLKDNCLYERWPNMIQIEMNMEEGRRVSRMGPVFVKKFWRCRSCRKKVLDGRAHMMLIEYMKTHGSLCMDCYGRNLVENLAETKNRLTVMNLLK